MVAYAVLRLRGHDARRRRAARARQPRPGDARARLPGERRGLARPHRRPPAIIAAHVSKRPITVSVNRLLRKRDAPAPRKLPGRRALVPQVPDALDLRRDAPEHARLRLVRAPLPRRRPRAARPALGRRALGRAVAGAARQRPAAVRRPRALPRPGREGRGRRQQRGPRGGRDPDRRPRLHRRDHGLLVPRRQHGLGGGREARPRLRPLRRAGPAPGRDHRLRRRPHAGGRDRPDADGQDGRGLRA